MKMTDSSITNLGVDNEVIINNIKYNNNVFIGFNSLFI